MLNQVPSCKLQTSSNSESQFKFDSHWLYLSGDPDDSYPIPTRTRDFLRTRTQGNGQVVPETRFHIG